jgi:integration host factor subunit alpha
LIITEDISMSLTKADIVERIYKEAGFSKKEAAELVDLVFKVIKDTLARGEKVKISGFGNFSIRDKATRVGRNPQTGDSMNISARRVLTFKPSQILKEDITSRYEHRIDDQGNEDANVAPKDGRPKALSSFIQEE